MIRPKPPLSFLIGASVTAVFALMAFVSLVFVPYDPGAIDIGGRFAAPSFAHWFGTDHLGRDILSMIMRGAQTSVAVALLAVLIGAGIGVPLGLVAAARGGVAEEALMRGTDIVFAFPAVIMAILITAVLGPGVMNAVIAIGVFNTPVFAQMTRGAARGLWRREFILSARVAGKGAFRISLEHILPNIVSLLVVQATIQFSLAIAAEAALSYIGLGAQPPTPSWGRMLNDAQTMFGWAPWISVFPGLAIVLSVLGLNMLGDGLRDMLDPRLTPRARAS